MLGSCSTSGRAAAVRLLSRLPHLRAPASPAPLPHHSAVTHARHAPRTAGPASRHMATSAKPVDVSWVPQETREEVARIVEQGAIAARSWEVVHTDFVTPPVAADALKALQGLADVTAMAWGGYAQAERCRLAIGREEVMLGASGDPSTVGGVAALEIQGNFMFDPASHRDFLGAMLGTGVKREAVGDILVQGENGAQALVAEHLVELFEMSLDKVRTVPVVTKAIPLSELRVKPQQVEEVRSVEASLRLDAVASAGFRVSRSKMMALIKGGDVRVNWRPVTKPSVDVGAGDVVSCAGKGRLDIKTIEMTKKEKYVVEMVRKV